MNKTKTMLLPASVKPKTKDRALTVFLTALSTVIVWTVAVPLAGVSLTVNLGAGQQMDVGLFAVLAATIVVGLAAWGLLSLLERWTSRARTIWTTAALAVLLVSLAGPLSAVETSAKLTLVLMHLVAGGLLIPMLRSSIRHTH
jgi:hypothetical protein